MSEAPAHAVTGAEDAAKVAAESGVKTVVLTHTTPSINKPGNREQVILEVGKKYKGKIIFADELTTLKL